MRHFALVLRCWRAAQEHHVLIHEFSTIPLLIVFPFLLPIRKRLLFLIHHNLQWAARSFAEHVAFRLLTRMGACWAAYEVQTEKSVTVLTLPHPVPLRVAGKKNPDRPVIGVAGYYRPEKGMGPLLQMLTAHFPDCDIVAGVPSPDVLQIPSVKAVNTTADADYRAMLAGCDVLVQNNSRESYYHRASGPVADAAASGAAVVAPDFPVIRSQIWSPVPVGDVFQRQDQIPSVVRKVVEAARAGRYDFESYCNFRSAQAVADRLDEFARRRHGEN